MCLCGEGGGLSGSLPLGGLQQCGLDCSNGPSPGRGNEPGRVEEGMCALWAAGRGARASQALRPAPRAFQTAAASQLPPASRSWEALPAAMASRRGGHAVAAAGGALYALGGFNSTQAVPHCEVLEARVRAGDVMVAVCLHA